MRVAQNIRAGKFPNGHEALYAIALSYFDGVEGLVHAMWEHYRAAPPGSRQAVGILGAFWKLNSEAAMLEQRMLAEYRRGLSLTSSDEIEEQLIEGVRSILEERGLEIVPKGVSESGHTLPSTGNATAI